MFDSDVPGAVPWWPCWVTGGALLATTRAGTGSPSEWPNEWLWGQPPSPATGSRSTATTMPTTRWPWMVEATGGSRAPSSGGMTSKGQNPFPERRQKMNEESSFEVEPFEFETNNGEWESEVNRSRRDYIKWVQRSLNQILGLQLAVDGISAAQTRSAIRSFQQQRGLTVDGTVGSQTERALITAGAGNLPSMVSPSSAPSRPFPGASPATSWVLPPAVQAAGERQSVHYDRPPSWDNGRNCTRSLSAGAAELRDHIRAAFRGISSIGGYNCRQNSANRAETSVHGTGRALDIMISPVNRRANGAVGDPIANWLVQNAQAVGIQYIIWNHTRWSGSRSGRKDGVYGGPNPHIDHIHVELNRDGASRATPWFSSRARSAGTDETRAGEVNYEGFDRTALPAVVQDLFSRGAVLWPAAVQRAVEAGMPRSESTHQHCLLYASFGASARWRWETASPE